MKPGDRVELISCTDKYTKLEPGAKGTVLREDDVGTIHVQWDDGHTLGLIKGEDSWRKIA